MWPCRRVEASISREDDEGFHLDSVVAGLTLLSDKAGDDRADF